MTEPEADWSIAEIPYKSGETHYLYSRYLSEDKSRWIKHGLFRSFYENGQLQSEGQYQHGAEEGLWRDFHENGQLAAEGSYHQGEEMGEWRFWNDDGSPDLS